MACFVRGSCSRNDGASLRVTTSELHQDLEQQPSYSELKYMEIPQPTELRYSQEASPPIHLESPTQQPIIYPTPFHSSSIYQPEGGSFYSSPSSHMYQDVLPRLNTTPSAKDMAYAQRIQLPQPAAPSTRELYSQATPAHRREHTVRSPPYHGSRRQHTSPAPSQPYTTQSMDGSGGYGSRSQQSIPPLLEMTTFGNLLYADGPAVGTPVKIDINGTIDKGFFRADNEWTCYRRNYFSCICSFSITPYYPATSFTFTQKSNSRSLNVNGFAISISAVVSDSDTHTIELVQHTPKRDKGPTGRPDKVRISPKPPQQNHHSLGMYNGENSMSVGNRYEHTYSPSHGNNPTEHTFERIQFKQATANNGKRRAAQQYYHLLVELWAEVGSITAGERFVKVAHRKSAKMIVRGRSPGHYQSERRGSTSSGPGGSAGSIAYGGSQVMGSDFGSTNSSLPPGTYGNVYDPRSSSHYGNGQRHHLPHSLPHHQNDITLDNSYITTEDYKAITDSKGYQYYPNPICDTAGDPRNPVELFTHSNRRTDHDNVLPQMHPALSDAQSKVKHEAGHETLPHIFYPGDAFYSANRCSRYEGKPTSAGYFPGVIPPSSMSMS